MLTIIILAIYLIGMLAIGLYLKNRVDSSEDYYVAGRGLPWYLVSAPARHWPIQDLPMTRAYQCSSQRWLQWQLCSCSG